jgi:hypothetical protein
MSTHRSTPRQIEHSEPSVSRVVLVAVALAFTTGCSFSLANKSPEILRYCKTVDRSELAGPDDPAAQRAPRPESTANGLPSDCDDTSCGGDASGEEASARRTVCAP